MYFLLKQAFGVGGGAYGGARPFLTAFSLHYSHKHLFLLANASEV